MEEWSVDSAFPLSSISIFLFVVLSYPLRLPLGYYSRYVEGTYFAVLDVRFELGENIYSPLFRAQAGLEDYTLNRPSSY